MGRSHFLCWFTWADHTTFVDFRWAGQTTFMDLILVGHTTFVGFACLHWFYMEGLHYLCRFYMGRSHNLFMPNCWSQWQNVGYRTLLILLNCWLQDRYANLLISVPTCGLQNSVHFAKMLVKEHHLLCHIVGTVNCLQRPIIDYRYCLLCQIVGYGTFTK